MGGGTTLLGVVGHPVGHSLSPEMHNASFAAKGLDYVYVPLDVGPTDLAVAVEGLRALGFGGFNVTMPHKEAIRPLVDEADAAARFAGAVNTVVVEGGRLHATNTDGPGFLEACAESGLAFAERRVLVVGAGGAAASIGAAVLGAGVAELGLLNRSAPRAEGLRRRLVEAYPRARVSIYPAGEPEAAARGADVIVNATYLGMDGDDPLPVPPSCLKEGVAVCDAVYRRGDETGLIRLARERGLLAVPGERMLLYQGVQAQRLWTGEEPDVEAMGRALS